MRRAFTQLSLGRGAPALADLFPVEVRGALFAPLSMVVEGAEKVSWVLDKSKRTAEKLGVVVFVRSVRRASHR